MKHRPGETTECWPLTPIQAATGGLGGKRPPYIAQPPPDPVFLVADDGWRSPASEDLDLVAAPPQALDHVVAANFVASHAVRGIEVADDKDPHPFPLPESLPGPQRFRKLPTQAQNRDRS